MRLGAPPAGTRPPQGPPSWRPSTTSPSRPNSPMSSRQQTALFIGGTSAFALAVAVVVVIIWGLLTHGFRDMRSYNMGYDMGNRDKHGEYTAHSGYRVGCDGSFAIAWDPRGNAGLILDDFRAGCRDGEK